MRIGIVRTDISSVYLSDLENSSQRNFSSEPSGQSRNIKYPTDAELTAAMVTGGGLAQHTGSDTAASVDTNPTNVLRVRAAATAAYTVITVTSGDVTAKTVILADINTQLVAAGLPLVAEIVGTNQIRIKTTVAGPTAYFQIDSSGSTLAAILGMTAAAYTGVSVSALRTAVYPTGTTIDVSSATIVALGSWTGMDTAAKATLVEAIADVVAPKVIETGRVLLSFDRGVISKLRSSAFQPGGTRSGIPAGIAAAVLANDGSTPFAI